MFPIIIISLLLIDQGTKYWAEHFLGDSRISIVGNFLMLSFVKNTGIAFSLPIEGVILKILTVVLIGIIYWYYLRHEIYKHLLVTRIGYMLILSGAISNGLERLFVGSVTDFISVKYFAIFNFADIFISIGAFMLFIIYFAHERHSK